MLGGDRIVRVNELIQQELSELIRREVEFAPGVLVTITSVRSSPDHEHAKVWVSVHPSSCADDVFAILLKEIGRLQYLLNKRLVMSPLPKIAFFRDTSSDRAQHLEHLLDTINDRG
ncbi:MAG: 30S ribosome-binding factor RbfA [Candidatus Kerfeldbacteria bacterium]